LKQGRLSLIASMFLATSLVLPGSLYADATKDNDTAISSGAKEVYEELNSNSDVQKVMDFIESDADNTLEQQIELTEIPAPPYMEEEKAEYYKEELEDLGLEDVHIDETGNVISTMPGSGDGPTIAVAAHLDIAFEEGVDTTVTEEDGIYYAPGIQDDNGGLATLLSVVRGFNEEDIETTGDIMFVGTVGEEDDFRGVDAFLDEHADELDGFIAVDGADPSTVTHGGTAGATIEFSYNAPGGHASGDYQTPSATHALGRATSEIADFGEEDPKTTFNVGTVAGGTVENAKAEEASMLTEFRTDGDEADEMKQKLIDAAEDGAKKENERWDKDSEDGVTVEHETKVDIPGGELSKDEPIVQAAAASTETIGLDTEYNTSGMNDANYSYGVDVPGINLGSGGESGKAHSLDEWYDPTDAHFGPQNVFMVLLGLSGMDGVTDPILGDEDGNGDDDNGDDSDGPKIENLEPAEDVDLKTGDSVKIEMDSETGLNPTFAIRMPLAGVQPSSSPTELPMMETSEGHYVGYWTVPSDLKSKGAEPQVTVKDEDGNEIRKETDGKLNINIDSEK